LVDRIHRVLEDGDIMRIARAYHDWRTSSKYADVPGFCKSATTEEIRDHNMSLVPGRYVGFALGDTELMSLEDIRSELKEIKDRIRSTTNASERALKTIQDLLYGTAATL
jgi:type I restriction enzyme M protein